MLFSYCRAEKVLKGFADSPYTSLLFFAVTDFTDD